MNDSYDIPSEPRLSNELHLNRPIPQARSKMKQKKRTPPRPPDSPSSSVLGLDDTMPLEEMNHRQRSLTENNLLHTSNYTNETFPLRKLSDDQFYVLPREHIRKEIDFNSKTLENTVDAQEIYAVPSNFSQNFVLESNVSFDDSEELSSVCLDSVPELISSESNSHEIYYSHPEQRTRSSREKLINNNNETKQDFISKLNRVLQQQIHSGQQSNRIVLHEEQKNYYSVEPKSNKIENSTRISSDSDHHSIGADQKSDKTTDFLDIVRENPSNSRCADCDCEDPTVAIMSWLLVICKKCTNAHRKLTTDFLELRSLLSTDCDPDLIDLIREHGNGFGNRLLEHSLPNGVKPNYRSTEHEREQYIKRKYVNRDYLQQFDHGKLDECLYENVETSNSGKTLHLLMSGANPNFSQKMFTVFDHAKRHQQWKQMKLVATNGGLSDFDIMKSNHDDRNLTTYETPAHLVTKHGMLKEFLTRYETDRLKIFSVPSNTEKHSNNNARCLFEIDLNNVLAICNQAANSVSLKTRSTNIPTINANSQCILIVDEQASFNEYVWIFPNELERALWTRELLKRQYHYHQLIYSDFILLTRLNVQEGINAEKQQAIAIVYDGRFVICSDTLFDEVDLRKYSSLTYQKTEEFTGVVLCLVSNRFLYLSSPIAKLTDMLFSCLRQATKVKNLSDLNCQILTSQNVPVIVERFINFVFEHGLESKGIYRQAGQESKVKQLLNEFLEDPFNNQLTRENYTEHEVASGLKRFLRQLETPLLGSRQNYDGWLRSTVDSTRTTDQLIQYYRGLLADLKQNHPIQYATLRKVLLHIHTVSMVSDRNLMSLSNLVSTFTPCIISQNIPTTIQPQIYDSEGKFSKSTDDTIRPGENDGLGSNYALINSMSPKKLQRNMSMPYDQTKLTSSTSSNQFPFSSSYARVTPSIQADLEIMTNLCQHYRPLFDVTDEEVEHEKKCVETLLSVRNNQCQPRKLSGTMVSVYFESRADELNGYAINILQNETSASTVIDKLLNQVQQRDCYFWALFEVIIDQNLERPMFSDENISNVLYRYRMCLPPELNRQATFVVKLNYVEFEKERLQKQCHDFSSVECEYFDVNSKRWVLCLWLFDNSQLQIHRVPQEKTLGWRSRFMGASSSATLTRKESGFNSNANTLELSSSSTTALHTWFIDDIYLYIGADRRYVHPFDMNEYRTLTILHRDYSNEISFGMAFRFIDRNQMFSWYLEITRINKQDQWTRQASRAFPNGVNYLPLQNYHTTTSTLTPTKKKSETLKTKLKSTASNPSATMNRPIKK